MNKGPINKETFIDDTLRDLCEALTAAASRTAGLARTAFWFKATYMEVKVCRLIGKNDEGKELWEPVNSDDLQGDEFESGEDEEAKQRRLVYVGWHTINRQPPESMSRGITFAKGEGTAGEAWEGRKPEIQDKFENTPTGKRGWVNNYHGQGKKYKSMICVPVFKGTRNLAGEVIGVITIDTRVDKFFGEKGDHENEDKYSGMVLPYATYIAFITSLNEQLQSAPARARKSR
jgi:hypothetical protein